MAKLLEQFASSLTASQRAAVNLLVNEQESNRQFESTQDIENRLSNLNELLTPGLPLLTVLTPVSGQIIDSGKTNTELRLSQLDLQVLYTELDNLGNTIAGVNEFLNRQIDNIQIGLSSLTDSINSLEFSFLEEDNKKVISNNFNSFDIGSLSHTHTYASNLYLDPRSVLSIQDLNTSPSLGGLTLPVSFSNIVPLVGIELLEGSETTASDLDINPTDNELSYVLQKDDGKSWINCVLKVDTDFAFNPIVPPDYVNLTLNFRFGGNKVINSITLKPLNDLPVTISSIQALSADGTYIELLNNDVLVSGSSQIVFDQTLCSEVKIAFKQFSYTSLTDFSYSDTPATTLMLSGLVTQATLNNLSIGYVTPNNVLYAKGYLYTLGLDFIQFGKVSFLNKGIYVTSPFNTDSAPVKLKLVIDESLGSNTVAEAYIAKYDYMDTILVNKNIVPIPISQTVEDEILIYVSGIGQTRMFPDYSTLIVKRNGTALSLGIDYQLSVDNGLNWRSSLGPLGTDIITGNIPTLQIKLLSPLLYDIYTVSYTPETINPNTGGSVFLDQYKTIYILNNELCCLHRPEFKFNNSDVMLILIMRSTNLAFNRDTGLLNSFKLLLGLQH